MDSMPQLAFVLVFALLGFALWWVRGRNPMTGGLTLASRSSRRIRTLERIDHLQLSASHSLNLVRMADRAILIGISPQGFCVVESAPLADITAVTGPLP